jgi:hypothetical protein
MHELLEIKAIPKMISKHKCDVENFDNNLMIKNED